MLHIFIKDMWIIILLSARGKKGGYGIEPHPLSTSQPLPQIPYPPIFYKKGVNQKMLKCDCCQIYQTEMVIFNIYYEDLKLIHDTTIKNKVQNQYNYKFYKQGKIRVCSTCYNLIMEEKKSMFDLNVSLKLIGRSVE